MLIEVYKLSEERTMEMTEKIYDSVLDILHHAEKENVSTHDAALLLAKSRVEAIGKVKMGR